MQFITDSSAVITSGGRTGQSDNGNRTFSLKTSLSAKRDFMARSGLSPLSERWDNRWQGYDIPLADRLVFQVLETVKSRSIIV